MPCMNGGKGRGRSDRDALSEGTDGESSQSEDRLHHHIVKEGWEKVRKEREEKSSRSEEEERKWDLE